MADPGKLLIVDDDLEVCRLLSLSLSPLGCEIVFANDGFQALEWIEAEQFNVAILDLMLPGPSGIDILKHIREQESEIQVIVLTAHASMETAIEAVRLGAYEYVTKPYKIDVLRSIVRRALEKQRLAARLTAIHDLSREMALLLEVDQVTEVVLNIAERVLEFDVCGLWLVDEERNELYLPATRGIETELETIPRLSLSGEKGITVAAARKGKLLYMPDVQEDPRYVAIEAANRSELAAPLKVKDRVIGVLNVESTEVDAFNPEDKQLLSTLAAQVAVAIENARLYEQTQQEITERRRAEEALRISERRYALATRAAQVGVWDLNMQSGEFYLDPNVKMLLGYSDDEIPNDIDIWATYGHPDDRQLVTEAFQAHIAGQTTEYTCEHRMLHKDGSIRWVFVRGQAIRDARGDVIRVMGTNTDITERMQAEQILNESRKQIERAKQEWEATVDALPQFVCLLDAQRRVLRANQTVDRWGLAQVADIQGREMHKLLHPHCVDPTCYLDVFWRQAWKELAHERSAECEVEDTILNRYLHFQVRPLSTQTGGPRRTTNPYAAVVVHDITERKWAEEEIKRRNQELAVLNEIGQAITSTLDPQETLTLITHHTTQLLGVAATAVLLYDENNDGLQYAAASGAGADLILNKHLTRGQGIAGWVAQHGEPALVPDVSKDPRWFSGIDKASGFATRSLLCVPLQSKGQTIGVLSAINKERGIFDQGDLRLLSSLAAPAATAIENARLFELVRNGREQLQALSRRLVEAQEEERGRIARELHDETSQALSSLLLGLSLLEREVDDPVTVITHINELASMVDRMLENLHRLSMNLRPATLDHLGLAPALEHYIESLSHLHGITMQFEMVSLEDERLPPVIETAIYRIVQEALTNVIRHAQAACVDVLLERRGDRIITIIEDDGIGFDPETMTQSNRLGLFGMRERAEMLNGTLVIESDAETGTTVLVELPYAYPDKDA